MRKLILRLLVFSFILLAVSYPLDLMISNWVAKVRIITSEDELWRDIYNQEVDAECYIYGSSRAKTHIVPSIIEDSLHISTYNFGNSGQPFNAIYLQHRKIVEYVGYPQYIILSIDPATLTRPKEIFNERQFVPYMLWDMDYFRLLRGYEGFSTADYFVPLLRYYSRVNFVMAGAKEHFSPSNEPRDRVKGYKNNIVNKIWTPEIEDLEESISDYPDNMVDEEQLRLIGLFIEECKKNNVSLAFVYTPINSLALDIMDRKGVNYNNYIHQIADQYSVPLLDYTKDPICYDKDYFSDSVHLNKKGSELVTRKMISDLQKIHYFK